MFTEILSFWFQEIEPSQWWGKDEGFDNIISERFSGILLRASSCELSEWRKCSKGRLAEIIVLDQFTRNIHRDSPMAFSNDSLALALSQEAISVGADKELNQIECCFLYMPFMHSESLEIHNTAEILYRNNGLKDNLNFELKHKEIIKKFGRYPHRNILLNRESTDDEVEFLKQPGSTF